MGTVFARRANWLTLRGRHHESGTGQRQSGHADWAERQRLWNGDAGWDRDPHPYRRRTHLPRRPTDLQSQHQSEIVARCACANGVTKNGQEERMGIIAWIIVGLVAGWLAGLIMKGGGYGLIGDLILGLIGAIVGGWLFGLIMPSAEPTGLIGSIIVATIGAVVLVAIVRLISGRAVRVDTQASRTGAFLARVP